MGPGAAAGSGPGSAALGVTRVDQGFLSLLRCPRTGAELRIAEPEELAAINESLGKGELENAAGHKPERAIEGALVSACGRWLYPVLEGIPVLLVEEAFKLGKH